MRHQKLRPFQHSSLRRKKRSVSDMDTATPDTGNDVDPGLLTALEAEDLIGNLETFLMQLGFRSVLVTSIILSLIAIAWDGWCQKSVFAL